MLTGISKRLKDKAKIEKEKETVKPTVINDKLIRYFFSFNSLGIILSSTIRKTECLTMMICLSGNLSISHSLIKVTAYL